MVSFVKTNPGPDVMADYLSEPPGIRNRYDLNRSFSAL